MCHPERSEENQCVILSGAENPRVILSEAKNLDEVENL